MPYIYTENTNYEDLSGGRVLYHRPSFTHYPVRLACEIFMRCLNCLPDPAQRARLYDPCCGGGYLLTVLGFLHGEQIEAIVGSDISPEAVELAERNVGLLTREGLLRRREQLAALYDTYGKDSHRQAVRSADNLLGLQRGTIPCNIFRHDILAMREADNLFLKDVPADIVITDVPYGRLAAWSEDDPFAINRMLDNLSVFIGDKAVICVSSDKRQKINNPQFKRVEKFISGKRKIEILTRA